MSKGECVMPLLDHFHPPLHPRHGWESFHSNWATKIADDLSARMPPDFQVEEQTHVGPAFEIDVATFEEETPSTRPTRAGTKLATRLASTYAPPAPQRTIPAAIP